MFAKILILVTVLCWTSTVGAQDYSVIKGYVKTYNLKTIALYATRDGDIQKQAETQINVDGSYGFLIKPEKPGFYAIGNERMNFILFLKGGEEVNVDLLENKAELNGKNTRENKALYKWEDYAANIRLKSVFFNRTLSTYEDFFPEFTTFLEGMENLKKSLKSGNKEFDAMLQKLVIFLWGLLMIQ